MIIKTTQITRGRYPKFTFTSPDTSLTYGKLNTNENTVAIDCFAIICDHEYTLSFNPRNALGQGAGIREAMRFHIISKGVPIGYFGGDLMETSKRFLGIFSKGYEYYSISFNGNHYSAYEVGLGNNGHYFCIYNSTNSLIAIVEHEMDVLNYKDIYYSYIDNEEDCALVALFSVYCDFTKNPDIEIIGASRQHKAVYTKHKELIAKYDPDFIPRIKARDGFN